MRDLIDSIQDLENELNQEIRKSVFNTRIVSIREELVNKRAKLFLLKSKANQRFKKAIETMELLTNKESITICDNFQGISVSNGTEIITLVYYSEEVKNSSNEGGINMQLFFENMEHFGNHIGEYESHKIEAIDVFNSIRNINE